MRVIVVRLLPVVILAWLFAACKQSPEKSAWLVSRAEALMEQNPDSALHYLQAVKKSGGLDRATLAAFYEGCVFEKGKDYYRALQAFLKAENLAGHISDNKRKGLIQHNIGYLYYNSGTNYGEAITRFKRAAGYFQEGNHDKYAVESLNLLGLCFLVLEQADSALVYQQQGLDMAVAIADTAAQAKVWQNMSVTHREQGNKQQAKTCALTALHLDKTAGETVNALLNLALLYYDCAQYDSADLYARQIQQLCEKNAMITPPTTLYSLQASIAKHNNNYKEALAYQEKYTEWVFKNFKEKEKLSTAGIQEKYDLEMVKNKNQQLVISRLWIFIIASLAVLFLTGVLFFLYYRNSRQKIKLLKAAQEQDRLHAMHTDIYKKAGLLKQCLKSKLGSEEQFNQIYPKITQIIYNTHEALTWEGIYPALNRQYNGLLGRLRKEFPQLSDAEFKICCLEYAGFKNKEMLEYVQLKLNTVQAKKKSIRKKLGVAPKGSIKEFLANFLTGNK